MNSGPRLYESYSRDAALAACGSSLSARVLCRGEWVILPEAIVCLSTLGQAPMQSHLVWANRFRWVAGDAAKGFLPGDETGGGEAWVPREARVDGEQSRPIYLFGQALSASSYTYLGRLAPTAAYTLRPRAGPLVEPAWADFDLSPVLPSSVWRKLTSAPPPETAQRNALDDALGRLNLLATAEDRLAVLDRLAGYWYGPWSRSEGLEGTRLHQRPLPYPLRGWYERAGRHANILGGQNHFLGPDELEQDSAGLLIFYVENQRCYEWATHAGGDDPPVFGRGDEAEPWTEEGMRLSEFLIQACIFEALYRAPYLASTNQASQGQLDAITAICRPLPFAPWRYPEDRTNFYAGRGVLMRTTSGPPLRSHPIYSIWIGALTEHDLAFLRSIADRNWKVIA